MLRFALRRLEDAQIGLLITVREEQAAWESLASAVAAERQMEAVLSPLSVAALHDVVHARLALPVARPLLVRVAQVSGGNPLYALEIMRELVRAGTLTGTHHIPIPPRVHELVRHVSLAYRYRRERRSCTQLRSPHQRLSPLGNDALAPAEDAALIEIANGRIGFAHPLVAAAVYESASPAERRATHQLLAERLPDGEERARHLALAGDAPDEAIARSLDAAATQAAARGAKRHSASSRVWARISGAEGQGRAAKGGDAPRTRRPQRDRVAGCAARGGRADEQGDRDRGVHDLKTVEANLTRVYRKLGIHSRAQLGRALDAAAHRAFRRDSLFIDGRGP